jgi:hypothetical protein
MHPKKRGRSELPTGGRDLPNVTAVPSTEPVNLHYQNVFHTTVKQIPFKRGAQREPLLGSDRAWHISNISNNVEGGKLQQYVLHPNHLSFCLSSKLSSLLIMALFLFLVLC